MKAVIALLCLVPLAGCSILETDAVRYQHQNRQWDTPAIYTTADVRVISKRHNPTLNTDVVCTEPTPDVAKALSTALDASANAKTAQTTGSVALSGGSAEAVAELAGRSTALLALRDSLFRSCEAYANGAIGANAYSLILARYGQLMTTLFLGEDIRGSVRAATAVASSPAVSGGGSGSKSQGASSSGDNSDGSNSGAATNKKTASASGAGSGGMGSNGAASGGGSGSTDNAAPSISAVSAVALARINEDYFDLDFNPMHLLVVACINEYDPTRLRQPGEQGQNSWLRGLCQETNSLASLAKLEGDFAKNQKELQRPAPALDPTVAWVPASQQLLRNTAKPASTAAATPTVTAKATQASASAH